MRHPPKTNSLQIQRSKLVAASQLSSKSNHEGPCLLPCPPSHVPPKLPRVVRLALPKVNLPNPAFPFSAKKHVLSLSRHEPLDLTLHKPKTHLTPHLAACPVGCPPTPTPLRPGQSKATTIPSSRPATTPIRKIDNLTAHTNIDGTVCLAALNPPPCPNTRIHGTPGKLRILAATRHGRDGEGKGSTTHQQCPFPPPTLRFAGKPPPPSPPRRTFVLPRSVPSKPIWRFVLALLHLFADCTAAQPSHSENSAAGRGCRRRNHVSFYSFVFL